MTVCLFSFFLERKELPYNSLKFGPKRKNKKSTNLDDTSDSDYSYYSEIKKKKSTKKTCNKSSKSKKESKTITKLTTENKSTKILPVIPSLDIQPPVINSFPDKVSDGSILQQHYAANFKR